MRLGSIIRKTLDVKDHRIVEVREGKDGIEVFLDVKRRRHRPCSVCGRRSHVRSRLPERRWRYIPIWNIPVILYYRPCRVLCPVCGIKVESIPWSLGKSPLSRDLVHVLALWARSLSWLEVSRLFKVSWGTVAHAVHLAVDHGLAERTLDDVCKIGIDEISRKRGHHYVTCVYDLDKKVLLWAGEDRTKKTLRSFFDLLGQERSANIEGVCCDMWEPYMSVIKERCPNAVMVFDKFHVVKHLSEAVDTVRRQEIRTMEETETKVLKGTRFIWLKNPEHLTDRQHLRLSDLVKQNLKIVKAYLLKEFFRKFWSYTRKGWAKRFLDKWFWLATHSRIKPLRDFAWMLRRHQEGILAFFDLRLTNAAVEGLNNKAKKVSHRAYGFSDANTFIINLYHCLGGLTLPQPCTNS